MKKVTHQYHVKKVKTKKSLKKSETLLVTLIDEFFQLSPIKVIGGTTLDCKHWFWVETH